MAINTILARSAVAGLALTVLVAALGNPPERVAVLTLPDLTGWVPHSFVGTTSYTPVILDGRPVLRAYSEQAASALIKTIDIDLQQTPFLHWTWRVDAPLAGLDETRKGGDDYAARVYVVVDGGPWFWRTRALSYVWAGSMPQGSRWPNAFSARSMMLALESGTARAGEWCEERRDVRADLMALHGIDVDHIQAVAIMTDTDNSRGKVTAYYGDIFFSAH